MISIRCGIVAVVLLALPSRAKPQESVSFTNDVVPLLTRYGCNQGGCHGKGSGQNGFRLSLRGYAPEWDHGWITREYTGRRINTAVPENSLLLLKPLGKAPHFGGKLFSEDSQAHRTLLAWIRAGAPGPVKGELTASRLEVSPAKLSLKPGQVQQLTVKAEFAPGAWRDVTWLCKLDSNDVGAVEIDANGKLRVKRPGETAIRVSFQTLGAIVIVTTPFEQSIRPEVYAGRNSFIDEYVFRKLSALAIEPSPLCSDAEFVRRVHLDAIGLPPTPDEVRAFLADARADKRSRLIDSLLARPEFTDYWALFLSDLLQNRKERDHDVRGSKGVRAFHLWLRNCVAENRGWDRIARDVLTAKGTTSENPAVGYYVVTVGERGEAHRSEVVASVAQAFLGTRVGCAECHNHPLERYTQDDYYHFAAFFSRMKLQRKDPKEGPTTLLVAGYDGKPAKGPVAVTQIRTGQMMAARPLDRSDVSIPVDGDPREALARWMTDPKNEQFSDAMVNRVWRHFMGVGLVEPVDDLRASNPPSNPELWQALNREFVDKKYDLRHLARVILNSRTYQLSSRTLPTNVKDTKFNSRYYVRRLPAEVLLDSISQATGSPERFDGYPVGMRAVQIPDPTVRSHFLTLFGRSDRVTACACERSGEVTLPQILHFQGGETLIRKVAAPEGRVALLLAAKKTDDEICAELFLAVFGRPAKPEEMDRIRRALAQGERTDVLRDVLWALLNSNEFAFNH